MGGPAAKSKNDSSSQQFRGPVLFVNHGVDNLKSSPHRHEVFTHVQNNYRRWRRIEDARSIRAGVRLPTTVPADQSAVFASTPGPSRRTSSISQLSPQDRERLRKAELKEALYQSESPVSFVKKGNSDPFSAYNFKVDPQANELIAFYRDYIIPCIYHTTSKRKSLSNTSAQRDFNDIVEGLKDEGGAYAFLARNAFVAARSNPAMRKAAAVYGDKSVKSLMKKIADGEDLHDQTKFPTITWHINCLWAAETIDGNLPGALAHGRMLRFLFEQGLKKGKVDFKSLLYVVYTDCQMSARFLVPPVFDVDEWLPKVLAPLSRMAAGAAAASLPPLSDDVGKNDPSINDLELQEIFTGRRETMQYWVASAQQEQEVEHSLLILAWIAFRAVISQGKLVNYYLKKVEDLKRRNLTDKQKNHLYTQTYLALAALYMTRLWSFNNAVLGIPMFDAGPQILARLQEIMRESDRPSGGPVFHQYCHARLWPFYVGAFGEQLNATMKNNTDDPCTQWFNRKLAKQAHLTGITTWDQASQIFRGFLHTDMLPPNGSTWFERTVQTHRSISSE